MKKMEVLEKKIRFYIEKLLKTYQGEISVYAKNFASGKEFKFNYEKKMYIASIIKLPIAITLYKKASEQKVDLDKEYSLASFHIRDLGPRDTGIVRILPKTTKVTLRTLTSLMLSISDNAATNIILEFVTPEEVNSFMRALGFKNTTLNYPRLDDFIDFEANFDIGSSTTQELSNLLYLLIISKILPENYSQEITNYLSGMNVSNRILRYLPTAKNYWDKKVSIKKYFWKGGTWPRLKVCADLVGLISNKDEIITLSIITHNLRDRDKYLRETAIDHIAPKLMSRIGLMLYKLLY